MGKKLHVTLELTSTEQGNAVFSRSGADEEIQLYVGNIIQGILKAAGHGGPWKVELCVYPVRPKR